MTTNKVICNNCIFYAEPNTPVSNCRLYEAYKNITKPVKVFKNKDGIPKIRDNYCHYFLNRHLYTVRYKQKLIGTEFDLWSIIDNLTFTDKNNKLPE